jgi:4-amino-4-deoxy-L-arabinose transferase-like glycosyltransferase
VRSAILTTAVFAICVVALLGALPLWLDEILQLLETRNTSTAEMIARLPRNSGAAPLGYLVQNASLRITGYGVRRARLPAAVFGVLSVFSVALLARAMGVRRAWLAAILFAAFPETLRYATESRVYSQALFFSIVATLLYLRLVKRPSSTLTAALALALTAAIYTQPFTIFIGTALVMWSALCRDRNAVVRGSLALAAASAAFLPWYLWSRAAWISGITQEGFQFVLSARTPLMIFREAAGAGYWGSGLLLVLIASTIGAPRDGSHRRTLLTLLILVPLLGALGTDAVAGYFIAARQFIWILPAAAILAATALESATLGKRSAFGRRFLILATVALLAVCIRQTVVFFRAPHENWQAAADAIALRAQQGACVQVAPADSLRLYEFFRPEIGRADCSADRRGADHLVLAITPVTTIAQRDAAIARLKSSGYVEENVLNAGLSTIFVFRRVATT